MSGYDWSTLTGVVRGSFWIAQPSTGNPIVITAYHNLKPCSTLGGVKDFNYFELTPDQLHTVANSKVIDGKYNILKSLSVRSSLTTLGYDITQVGTVAENQDLALLKTDVRVIARMKTFKLATHLPHEGEKVTAIGLPGEEPFQIPVSTTVNFVQGKFFMINVHLDPGFSGGVVLNESGEAYGFISTVTEKASTVHILNGETLSSAKWLPYAPIVIE